MGAANVVGGGGGTGAQSSLVALHIPLGQAVACPVVHAPVSHIWAGVSMPAAHVAPAPQRVPFVLLSPSRHTGSPVVHARAPSLHALPGFVVHGSPTLQATQVPALLQTLSVSQVAPAAFCMSLLQTIAPVLQL